MYIYMYILRIFLEIYYLLFYLFYSFILLNGYFFVNNCFCLTRQVVINDAIFYFFV